MPASKPKTSRKKTQAQPQQQPQEAAGTSPKDWADTDGLTGHGADSALAHLRDRESRRIEKTVKDKG